MKNPYELFIKFLASRGLKSTPQRKIIVDVFLSEEQHLTTEELYAKIKEIDKSIGQATVYRTLKLLCEANLAKELHFGDGCARYETTHNTPHHDHLICTECNEHIGFIDNTIEQLQEELAALHNFKLTSHRMYLYGICEACQKKQK